MQSSLRHTFIWSRGHLWLNVTWLCTFSFLSLSLSKWVQTTKFSRFGALILGAKLSILTRAKANNKQNFLHLLFFLRLLLMPLQFKYFPPLRLFCFSLQQHHQNSVVLHPPPPPAPPPPPPPPPPSHFNCSSPSHNYLKKEMTGWSMSHTRGERVRLTVFWNKNKWM